MALVRKHVRTFATTSVGRLFDAAAALLGFTREVTFEGQAAIWLEQLARRAPLTEPYAFPFIDGELDFRPLLLAVAQDRVRGRDVGEIARSFQHGIAQGLRDAVNEIASDRGLDTVVLSGGVFQNELLLRGLEVSADKRTAAGVDKPCSSAQRRRHQPGTGGTGGVRPLRRRPAGEPATESSYA